MIETPDQFTSRIISLVKERLETTWDALPKDLMALVDESDKRIAEHFYRCAFADGMSQGLEEVKSMEIKK